MSRTILVVEDAPDLLFLSKYVLRLGGATGVFASRAAEVDHVDLSRIDAAAVDWMLHGSDADGVDIVEMLLDARPDLPVLVFSASAEGARRKLDAIGLTDVPVVSKPYTWDNLVDAWGWSR